MSVLAIDTEEYEIAEAIEREDVQEFIQKYSTWAVGTSYQTHMIFFL